MLGLTTNLSWICASECVQVGVHKKYSIIYKHNNYSARISVENYNYDYNDNTEHNNISL